MNDITQTQATLYSLAFGTKAVLLVKIHIPSLQVEIQEKLSDEKKIKVRLTKLEGLDEIHLKAQ